MVFPINQLKIDPSYVSVIEDEFENNILAKYTAFKKGSAALVMAFKKEKDKYGSIDCIPHVILKKYNHSFNSLFSLYKNLRDDLQRGVNRNTKELLLIRANGDEDLFINELVLRRRESFHGKMGYFDTIHELHIAISSLLEK